MKNNIPAKKADYIVSLPFDVFSKPHIPMKKFSLLLFIAMPFLMFSQEDKWTPEEIINTVYVSNPEFSKDGSKVVWTQRKGLEKEDKFVSHLYLARLEYEAAGGLEIRTLTLAVEK